MKTINQTKRFYKSLIAALIIIPSFVTCQTTRCITTDADTIFLSWTTCTGKVNGNFVYANRYRIYCCPVYRDSMQQIGVLAHPIQADTNYTLLTAVLWEKNRIDNRPEPEFIIGVDACIEGDMCSSISKSNSPTNTCGPWTLKLIPKLPQGPKNISLRIGM